MNETSARLVAAGVVAQAVAFLVWREGWLLVLLAYGFGARALCGPTFSPLARFATRLATPFVEGRFDIASRLVAGPPKRFAQVIGLAVSGPAGIAWLTGFPVVSYVLLAVLIVAATLESVFAVCLGCIIYSAVWGCDDCDDISERLVAGSSNLST